MSSKYPSGDSPVVTWPLKRCCISHWSGRRCITKARRHSKWAGKDVGLRQVKGWTDETMLHGVCACVCVCVLSKLRIVSRNACSISRGPLFIFADQSRRKTTIEEQHSRSRKCCYRFRYRSRYRWKMWISEWISETMSCKNNHTNHKEAHQIELSNASGKIHFLKCIFSTKYTPGSAFSLSKVGSVNPDTHSLASEENLKAICCSQPEKTQKLTLGEMFL